MKRSERGYALAALLATITVMMILMAAAVPSWKYVVKNEKEEELIFRGGQIADAIRRFQAKNGNALPASLDVLVKGKFLRKAYTDPMVKDGKWRLIRQGEPIPAAGGAPRAPGASPAPSPSPSARPGTAPTSPFATGGAGTSVGAFVGVASLSTEPSLRLFNNREKYSEWFFIAGQPRVVGKQVIAAPQQLPGGAGPRPPGSQQPSQRPPGAGRPPGS